MCVYAYTYIRTYAYIYIYAPVYMCIHAQKNIHAYTCNSYMHIYIYIYYLMAGVEREMAIPRRSI